MSDLFYPLKKNNYYPLEALFQTYRNRQQKSNAMHEKITNSKTSKWKKITDFQVKRNKQPDLITGMHVQFWGANNWAGKCFWKNYELYLVGIINTGGI